MREVESEKYVPIDDVATHFSLSIATIRLWVKQGRIPKTAYIKFGTTRRFKISAVEEALLAGEDGEVEVETLKLY